MLETKSAWSWTHNIVPRNLVKQSNFLEMLSTQHPAELKDITTLDFLCRTGLWQWETNQDLEAGLKITLKHANRADFISKSPICLLPPSFPPFLYYILYFTSSSSLGLMVCLDPSISSGTTKHRAELAWESQATALYWNKLPRASCSTLAGHVSTLQPPKGTSHRVIRASHVL